MVTPPQLQASLLARDGTLLTTVSLPDGRPNRVTNDEQLILDVQGSGVRWLPLRAGVAPYAPEQTLWEGSISLVYLPPSGDSTAPPQHATLATPPPAVLAPITRLSTVANDIAQRGEQRLITSEIALQPASISPSAPLSILRASAIPAGLPSTKRHSNPSSSGKGASFTRPAFAS